MSNRADKVRSVVLEEADAVLLQGGEIPEVAMFESLHYLKCEGFQITEEEKACLRLAVAGRYMDIIRRDLNPENRNRPEFRSPRRAGINYSRLKKYSEKYNIDIDEFRREAGDLLNGYLKNELEVFNAEGKRPTPGMSPGDIWEFYENLECGHPDMRDIMTTLFGERREDRHDFDMG